MPSTHKKNSRQKLRAALFSLSVFVSPPLLASDDMKALLEILLEKGIITQQEFDNKLKKANELEASMAQAQAPEIKKPGKDSEARAESESKLKTEIYGQISAGYYSASNMTSTTTRSSGMSDQPKGNNR